MKKRTEGEKRAAAMIIFAESQGRAYHGGGGIQTKKGESGKSKSKSARKSEKKIGSYQNGFF